MLDLVHSSVKGMHGMRLVQIAARGCNLTHKKSTLSVMTLSDAFIHTCSMHDIHTVFYNGMLPIGEEL